MTPSLKTTTAAWKDPSYRKPIERAPVSRSPEQIAESREFYRSAREQLQREQADTIAKWNAKNAERVKNREARDAVEGDTDLNHDNLETADV